MFHSAASFLLLRCTQHVARVDLLRPTAAVCAVLYEHKVLLCWFIVVAAEGCEVFARTGRRGFLPLLLCRAGVKSVHTAAAVVESYIRIQQHLYAGLGLFCLGTSPKVLRNIDRH